MTTPIAISPGWIDVRSDLVFLAGLIVEDEVEDDEKTAGISPVWLGVLGIIIVSLIGFRSLYAPSLSNSPDG